MHDLFVCTNFKRKRLNTERDDDDMIMAFYDHPDTIKSKDDQTEPKKRHFFSW